MTVEGEESLQKELQHLITDVRPNITKKIAEAREFGDLKENAEYHAAKEQQGLTEARIREIEGKLSASQIIDIKKLNAQEGLFLDLRFHFLICKTKKKSAIKL
jgi:transcription elongation factor GreA